VCGCGGAALGGGATEDQRLWADRDHGSRDHERATVGDGRVAPIGGAIANMRVFVLDGGLEPAPVKVIGEFYAAGDGLARAYASHTSRTGLRVARRGDGLAGRTLRGTALRALLQPCSVSRLALAAP
jgi:non-ribosomal peptide synthetase component F